MSGPSERDEIAALAKWLTENALRIRWAGRDFRPLFSERYGHRRWLHIGRLGIRWEARRFR